ncbi:uncharacterized protein BDV14DRAFT_121015 [Aspergillus stella-maris]|uniref:uncharacterized protein n=1 Tax=Aspergillus stella-maris TaxID=1810926 RepID=UPI003CCD3541
MLKRTFSVFHGSSREHLGSDCTAVGDLGPPRRGTDHEEQTYHQLHGLSSYDLDHVNVVLCMNLGTGKSSTAHRLTVGRSSINCSSSAVKTTVALSAPIRPSILSFSLSPDRRPTPPAGSTLTFSSTWPSTNSRFFLLHTNYLPVRYLGVSALPLRYFFHLRLHCIEPPHAFNFDTCSLSVSGSALLRS